MVLSRADRERIEDDDATLVIDPRGLLRDGFQTHDVFMSPIEAALVEEWVRDIGHTYGTQFRHLAPAASLTV
jgi:hypothetical protein